MRRQCLKHTAEENLSDFPAVVIAQIHRPEQFAA
jgi:hypothetical protein